MSPDEAITAVKQAANALYALGWSDSPIGPEDRQKLRQLSDNLDQVTKALGGNPMTPAWGIPGNPRAEREATDGHSDSATSARTPTRPADPIGAET